MDNVQPLRVPQYRGPVYVTSNLDQGGPDARQICPTGIRLSGRAGGCADLPPACRQDIP
jgi:hypothetical protein